MERLSLNDVQIWLIDLKPAIDLQACMAWLSREERARAKTFLSPGPFRQFVFSRVAIKQILAGYSNCSPRDVRFIYNKYGKPSLVGADVHFNLSHSGGFALCAVSLQGDLGVDIEIVRPLENLAEMASRIFSNAELKDYQSRPLYQRLQKFFEIYTRKEAFLKGLGTGLSVELGSFDSHGSLPLSIVNLNAPKGYAAALAVRLANCNIKYFQFSFAGIATLPFSAES